MVCTCLMLSSNPLVLTHRTRFFYVQNGPDMHFPLVCAQSPTLTVGSAGIDNLFAQSNQVGYRLNTLTISTSQDFYR